MQDAIDAEVVLALATKAGQVFKQGGTYLSIPLSPLAFRADALVAAQAGDTPEGLRAQAELSYLVNTIPDGPLWAPIGGSYLWDVYGDVLLDAERASDRRMTKKERRALQKALALLTVAGPQGRPADSPAVIAYRECRDAWLAVQQEYNNARGHAETSGPEESARWQRDDEPALHAHVLEAEERWATEGQREAIDAARATRRRLADRSPERTWQTYLDRWDPRLNSSFRSDFDLGRFVPTGLRPADGIDGTWYRISLEPGELTQLAAEAPPEVRARFPFDGDSGVERLSFEYTSVGVSRGWLAPEVFESRAWRLPAGRLPLSDGAEDPNGRCTAYVAGLVLARNVTVTPKAPPAVPAPASAATPATAVPNFHLGFVQLQEARFAPAAHMLVARPLAGELRERPTLIDHLERPGVATIADDPLVAQRLERADAAGRRGREDILVRRPRPEFEALRPIDDPGDPGPPEPEPDPVPAPDPDPVPDPEPDAEPEPEPVPAPDPVPDPAPDPTAPVTTPEGELYVLGFICKRIGRCPDPDPALEW